MLPKQLHTVNSRGGVTALRDDQTFDVGLINSAEIAAEIVRRWNAFEAIGEALRIAEIDAKSRLHMLPINADETDRAILNSQITQYRNALAAYLPADQRQDMRGQNIDTKA